MFFSMLLTVTVFLSHSHSFVKLVRFEAPVLLTNNEAKLQESTHANTWQKTSLYPTKPASGGAAVLHQQTAEWHRDQYCTHTPADRVDTHHAQPDFKFTQVDPVTFTTLLETSEYCCMDVIPFQKLNDLLLAGIGPILCVFVWFHLFVTVQIFIFLSVFTLSPRWSTFACFKILITF